MPPPSPGYGPGLIVVNRNRPSRSTMDDRNERAQCLSLVHGQVVGNDAISKLVKRMVWFFEKQGAFIRCETRDAPDGDGLNW